MNAVDQAVRFVKITPQFVSVPLVASGTTDRQSTVAPLDRLKLARDVLYLLVQCGQQLPRLGYRRFIDHRGIVSSVMNLRDWIAELRIDDDPTTPHTALVAETSEQMLVADVERRLATAYPQLLPERVSLAVTQAHAHFDRCRVRDFVPLLVERRARGELAKASQTVAAVAS